MKVALLLLVAGFGLSAVAAEDAPRDGRYLCQQNGYEVRVTLDTPTRLLRLEDANGIYEAYYAFLKSKDGRYESYLTGYDNSLRFDAKDNSVQFTYCYGCNAFACKKE